MVDILKTVVASDCGGLIDIVKVIRKVIDILKILIPIGLIAYGLLDLGKAVIAGKEDEMKKAQGTLIRRCIYALAVFLVVNIVIVITGLVGADDWKACWKKAGAASTIKGGDMGTAEVD